MQRKGRKNNPDSEYSVRILSGAGGPGSPGSATVGIPVCFLYLAAESYLFRMTTSERKSRKIYYTMGEVSEMFDVNASLIRFWETKFDILRPQKNKKGNRLFSPADVENLKLIYHLVKERGMTLDGAARCLKQNKGTISRDAELLERLQRVRALLEEVRAELKESAEDRAVVAENGAGEAAEVSALPVRTRKKPAAQELADDAGGDGAESKGPVQVIEPGPRSEKPAPKRSAARQPRRKKEKEEAESKELFAFYEQSLF